MITNMELEIRYSMEEPTRPDAFEKPASTVRFPSSEQIQAVRERRALFAIPNFPSVMGIAEGWKEVLMQDLGYTEDLAKKAFDDLLNNVFPALTANANSADMRSASYALEEPIITLAGTRRCNGGRLNTSELFGIRDRS